jgi:hypothetical protein
MQHLWNKWMFNMLQFNLGGSFQRLLPKVQFMNSIIGWVSSTSMWDNGGGLHATCEAHWFFAWNCK